MAITLRPGGPTDNFTDDSDEDFYPTSDGKPMAETELHRNLMIYTITGLSGHYRDDPDAYVSGNNFLYYERGNPKKFVSPDCYVVFGVEKRLRDTYKVWEENGILPSVVFEFTSKTTRREDTRTKRPLYEEVLRVPEYFQFDPTGDYLKPRLQGLRLVEGRYKSIPLVNDRMHSEILGLDLVIEGNWLRFYDPVRDVYLLTPEETALRAEQEARRAEAETLRANSAEVAARRAEAAAQRVQEMVQRIEEQTRRTIEVAKENVWLRAEAEALQTENARLRSELEALRKQGQKE